MFCFSKYFGFFCTALVLFLMPSGTVLTARAAVFIEGELADIPFFLPNSPPQQQHPMIELKVVMISDPELFPLSNLGIKNENIIFHTGLFCSQGDFIVPPRKGVVIGEDDEGCGAVKTIYVVFYHDYLLKSNKGRAAKALDKKIRDCSIVPELGSINEDVKSRLTLYLSHSELGEHSFSSDFKESGVGFDVLVYPKKTGGEVELKDATLPLKNKALWDDEGMFLSIKYKIREYHSERKGSKSVYVAPGINDIFKKKENRLLRKEQETIIGFETTCVVDDNEIKTHRYHLSQKGDVLCVTYHDYHGFLYAQPLPLLDEFIRNQKCGRSREVLLSPQLKLFLNYNLISDGGRAYNLMVVYLSDKNTVSIGYKPGEPLHFCLDVLDSDVHNGYWRDMVEACWRENLKNRLEKAFEQFGETYFEGDRYNEVDNELKVKVEPEQEASVTTTTNITIKKVRKRKSKEMGVKKNRKTGGGAAKKSKMSDPLLINEIKSEVLQDLDERLDEKGFCLDGYENKSFQNEPVSAIDVVIGNRDAYALNSAKEMVDELQTQRDRLVEVEEERERLCSRVKEVEERLVEIDGVLKINSEKYEQVKSENGELKEQIKNLHSGYREKIGCLESERSRLEGEKNKYERRAELASVELSRKDEEFRKSGAELAVTRMKLDKLEGQKELAEEACKIHKEQNVNLSGMISHFDIHESRRLAVENEKLKAEKEKVKMDRDNLARRLRRLEAEVAKGKDNSLQEGLNARVEPVPDYVPAFNFYKPIN